MTVTRSMAQPSATARLRSAYWLARALGVQEHLAHRGLAHVQVGVAAQMAGRDLRRDSAHGDPIAKCGLAMASRMSTACGPAAAVTASSAYACNHAAMPRCANSARS